MILAGRTGEENLVIRGARVLDPEEGIDATLDVRIDNGVIAQIDARVADSDAALVADQVRAGLVVRMAVLYDLLTTGPVAVETAVGVA